MAEAAGDGLRLEAADGGVVPHKGVRVLILVGADPGGVRGLDLGPPRGGGKEEWHEDAASVVKAVWRGELKKKGMFVFSPCGVWKKKCWLVCHPSLVGP